MNQVTRIAEDAAHDAGHTRRWSRTALFALPLLAMAGVGVRLAHHGPEAAAPPPSVVQVSTPLEREVDQWDDYVGRFAASKAVEVRPRVSGAITAVHFRDGQMVKQGDLLFTVDPRPYGAALAEAQAGVATAESALALARSDYERASRLKGDDAVSAGEIDALGAKVRTATAALSAARARARTRALDVEFTQVRAPISGRISDRRVDAGNLVVGGEGAAATLLTTINALDPIYFSFDASEALYLKARRAQAAGADQVQIRLQGETGYDWKGKLDFTDNGVDPRSGTIRARATIANPKLVLTPGLFGNMRLASGGTARALLVPDTAIQADQADKAVLVVDKDGTVALRKVVLGPVVDGLRIIASGLAPGDRVVIGGNIAAAPGSKVQPQPGTIVAKPDPVTPPSAPVAADATFASR
ncbi:efflux RND transporter periplasmic adaptor subunit [Sphingomonas sp. PR090111-T3T-6A]|uniref:efflux RND transporter periplasmic adaptor subunit n=1 Tax=Sphingomonas sp. PR090111-T3T-6A TaxID=685778 RepID=UPI0003A0A644|nr:efflux RND transporter periplasmic adaptor subunit [Sphingomonas sp. PR090111-T3T-6A]